MPHAQRKIIFGLSKSDKIILLKQEKIHGVVVANISKYAERCLEMLSAKQFAVVGNDPIK